MPKIHYEDYIGQKFSKLTILDYAGVGRRGIVLVNCKCDCGKIVAKPCSAVVRGKVKSCGCGLIEYKEKFIKEHTTHGLTHTRLYRIYHGMITRCENKNRDDYKRYGARGISVCREWKDDYLSFKEWAINNGYRDDLTIERKNVEVGYSPENCCWVDRKGQSRNKENTIYLTYKEIKKPLVEWAEELGISYWTLINRRKRGWSDTEIIEGKRDMAERVEE
jgi:hypothetical protein